MGAALACALAIGGLDPGGGAGVVADLRALATAGAFGCAVVAVQTIQSTAGMKAARAVATDLVVAQATEVLRHQRVRAVKLGALGSATNVRAVASLLREHASVPMVLDTPMVATRGRGRLLDRGAVDAIVEGLVPLATVVTVNADEASALSGRAVRTVSDAHDAAVWLVREGGARAAVVKGGHLAGRDAVDVMAVGEGARASEVVELRAKRILVPGARGLHGTGCTFASLVAGRLAQRRGARASVADIVSSVRWAKRVHHAAISKAATVGAGARILVF